MTNPNQNLFGLVLAGGKSSRMGKDKSAIIYQDKPQLQVAYELLVPLCSKVFISSRQGQELIPPCQGYPRIDDDSEFEGKGPLSGILSAMNKYPDVSWLLLACDLPFITPKTIEYLLANRNAHALATSYRSQFDGLPEPLCAVWEKGNFEKIHAFFLKGIHCPRKILIQSNAHVLAQQSENELNNINNLDEQSWAIEFFKKGKRNH